jgi:hypothetical protein
MGVGDAICQYTESSTANEDEPFELDVQRTGRMMVTGFLVSGPYSSANHVMMERLFPGATGSAVIKKIATSTTIAPLSMSLSFTSVILLTPEMGLSDARNKIVECVPTTWVTGCCYWPFVMAAVFRCVPLANRSMATSFAGTLWSVFLSHQMNAEETSLLPAFPRSPGGAFDGWLDNFHATFSSNLDL